YQLENADGTVTLLALEALGKRKKFFDLLDFKIVLGNPIKKECPSSVLLKISVDGKSSLVADEGIGPVNAIDNALRKGLGEFYPSLSEMRLSDYRVRVIDSRSATAARVIVNIESHDSHRSWRTTGVSPDIIEASWNALCESVEYKLSADSGLI
ncbi:MAG: alpha-isopropylmalate synthase regulatory domain-containing protein, partial [Ruminococcus sp.]|nr:alpha-isopropylmalate synthase regulatory domain-containing protein [Ruminococcus sp.]